LGSYLGYKKFILWLIIFIGYIGFLHLFSDQGTELISGSITQGISGNSIVAPGISNMVTVQVIRAPKKYWLGLITAPAYVLGMNIDSFNHLVIDYTMPLLLVIFIIWEFIIGSRKGKEIVYSIDSKELKEVKGINLVKKIGGGKNMKKNMLKFLAKSFGIGIVLAFICFLFGDSPAIALGLLVIYLEIKSKEE
jgi:hypothetical protein